MTDAATPAPISDALAARVFDALPVPMMVHDSEPMICAVNLATCRVLGAEDDSILRGRSVTEIVHPDGLTAGEQRRDLLFARNQRFTSLTVKLRTVSGATFYVEGMACGFVIGETPYALVAGVTPHGELGAGPGVIAGPTNFEPGTTPQAAALHALPLPVCVHDAERIVYANEATLRAVGIHSLADVVGRPVTDLTHDDTRRAERERRAVLLAQDTVLDRVEAKGVAADGSAIYSTCRAASFLHEGQRLVVWVITELEHGPAR